MVKVEINDLNQAPTNFKNSQQEIKNKMDKYKKMFRHQQITTYICVDVSDLKISQAKIIFRKFAS